MRGLNIPGVRTILLEDGHGFPEVGQLAVDQELLFLEVKVLVIITGFAEVEAKHPAIISSVLAALGKVLQNVAYRKIIVGAPIPRPRALPSQLKQLFDFSKQLQLLCRGHDRLEYTKSGLMFYGPKGVYVNLMHEESLSTQGCKRLTTQLLDRVSSVNNF